MWSTVAHFTKSCMFYYVFAPLISGIYKACQEAHYNNGEIVLNTIFGKNFVL